MPGCTMSTLFNCRATGTTVGASGSGCASGGGGPRGGVSNPFPGSSTITSVMTPLPPTSFGHGGGISSAEMPIGLSSQDLDFPVPRVPL